MAGLRDGRLVSPNGYDAMRHSTVPAPQFADYGFAQYGLGLVPFNTPCGAAYGQSGTVNGYATSMYASPTKDRIVVISAAEGSLDFLELTMKVMALARQELCRD